jgi:TonB family protein
MISEPEKEAFLDLETDAERDRFIEQFWAHRKPSKEEYYQRIDYANARFASDIAGSKTDQGKIYILNGPPDEIDYNPGRSPQDTVADVRIDVWRYARAAGATDSTEYRFALSSDSGNYHLMAQPATPAQIRVGPDVQSAGPGMPVVSGPVIQVAPEYPALAKEARIEGIVRLRVKIGKDGHVIDVEAISGRRALRQAAEDAVRQWVYKPTLWNGEPIEVTTEGREVHFALGWGTDRPGGLSHG